MASPSTPRPVSRKGSARRLPLLGDPLDRPICMEIRSRIKQAKKIVILGHERPDGDCIGSTLALGAILAKLGHAVQVVVADKIPERFHFLDGKDLLHRIAPGQPLNADLILVLDTTGLDRLGSITQEMFGTGTVVNIDHHISNTNFGVINWVDSTAAAAGELIWRLAACCGWPVPAMALEALYTALVTDTGQFAYSNTTPRILRMAAELVEAGVDPEATWRRIFLNKRQAELTLEARARNSLEVWADGKVASIAISQKDFNATHTGPEVTQEFAGIPRALAGAKLALFFYEVDGGKTTKISIRSVREIDACALAQQFGGGGHRQAAGCSIHAPVKEAIKRFRPAAEQAVANAREERAS